MERADLAGIQQGEAIDAMSGTVAGILGGSPEDGRQAIAAMGDVAGTVGAGLPRAAIPQPERVGQDDGGHKRRPRGL